MSLTDGAIFYLLIGAALSYWFAKMILDSKEPETLQMIWLINQRPKLFLSVLFVFCILAWPAFLVCGTWESLHKKGSS